jgi:hypothetical protein
VHNCVLSSKMKMQAIICVTMEYETICSTVRAVAAQSHVAYVPHTMTEYLALIDRPAYLAHVAAVGVAVAGGHALLAALFYSEALADAHDQLQNAFNSHIDDKRWDVAPSFLLRICPSFLFQICHFTPSFLLRICPRIII